MLLFVQLKSDQAACEISSLFIYYEMSKRDQKLYQRWKNCSTISITGNLGIRYSNIMLNNRREIDVLSRNSQELDSIYLVLTFKYIILLIDLYELTLKDVFASNSFLFHSI